MNLDTIIYDFIYSVVKDDYPEPDMIHFTNENNTNMGNSQFNHFIAINYVHQSPITKNSIDELVFDSSLNKYKRAIINTSTASIQVSLYSDTYNDVAYKNACKIIAFITLIDSELANNDVAVIGSPTMSNHTEPVDTGVYISKWIVEFNVQYMLQWVVDVQDYLNNTQIITKTIN